MQQVTWQEFCDTGLMWWINRQLHLFGYVIVREQNPDGTLSVVYPAKTEFRGFTEELETKGFEKLTKYINKESKNLLKAL